MDNPKATDKNPSPDASSPDPSGDKAVSNAKVLAAQKLDDIIEGQRKDSSGRRMERQQSRRLTSLSSRRNLMDASPSMSVRKTRLEALLESGNAKNPPPSTDSSPASQSGRKEPPDNHVSSRMSKTSANLQQNLEAKSRARCFQSSATVRNMGASSPSFRNLGAKKAPPPPPSEVSLNQPSLSGPGRKLSHGEYQPSRIPHFAPSRLQSPQVELEMGGLNRPSRSDTKRSGLLSRSNSVRRLPAQSFRRNDLARESSMTVLRHSATSNSRDLDQLIAYKTGIPLENPNAEDIAERKPPAVPSAASRGEEASEDNGLVLPTPQASYAAAPPGALVASMSGMTNNRDLDELIAYKTGIPLQDSNGEETEEVVVPVVGKDQMVKNGGFPNQMAKRPDGLEGADVLGGTDEDWVEQENLAIAIEVQEDMDEDAFIPSAIQYDPDTKAPIYKNRRFRISCGFLFGIAAVTIVGVLSFVPSQSDIVPEVELTSEPTKAQSIKSIIELIVGREKLEDRGTPHFAALDWITNADKLQVEAEDRLHLIQRYVLALFHFQTSNWYSCGATNKTVFDGEDGCLFQELVSFFPHRYRSLPSYRWLSSEHECQWAGIRCDIAESVRGIFLPGQKIRGNLPQEFKELDGLDSISLQWNDLTGTIPEDYGDMKQIVSFEVHYNQLTGTLPKSFFAELRNLLLLNVGQNFLSGTIPPSIKNLVRLRGLYIFNNGFRGQIPDEIGELSVLTFVRLDKNSLTGTLPTTLGRLNLEELWVSRQDISGQLPSELGNIHHMASIDFHSTSLNGTIPEEFYNMTALQTLDLYDSSLSGTLSSNVGRLTDIRALRINDSSLKGSLPKELGDLSRLRELWVHGNTFDGVVPVEVCSLKELESLEVVNADCLPMDESGISQISCDCCNTCCNPQSKACKPVGE